MQGSLTLKQTRSEMMPRIYLSPSTQENNLYVNGGTEEYYMNLLADALVPYLQSSGIQYTRNTPEMTAASSIRQANQGNYDFYLALHSNAAPEGSYGSKRGTDVYYYQGSTRGQRAANIFVRNLKTIYPLPSLVRTVPTTSIGEVTKTRAPANLIELAYHDNENDASWIKNNIPSIARNLALSLTEYFGIPLVMPQPKQNGMVAITSGYLNIRSRPNMNAPVIGRAYNNNPIVILGSYQDWYVVDYNGVVGYANSRFIKI